MDTADVKMRICKNCGNSNHSLFGEMKTGYFCKACGAPHDYIGHPETTECLIGFNQIQNYHFDDAETTFSNALRAYPNSVFARWGHLLASYGVVHVKGFHDHDVKPTFCFHHYSEVKGRRFQNEKLYLEMLELLNDNAEMKELYQKKAVEIDKALERFKRDRKKTERDVFLCVKISNRTEKNPDAEGNTADSAEAEKLYDELTGRGLRVFYSNRTLPASIETDNDVWSNLLKSKKMLLIVGNEDYLNSAWVKSEWNRWLYLNRQRELSIYVPHQNHVRLPQALKQLDPFIFTPRTKNELLRRLTEDVPAPLPDPQKKPRSRSGIVSLALGTAAAGLIAGALITSSLPSYAPGESTTDITATDPTSDVPTTSTAGSDGFFESTDGITTAPQITETTAQTGSLNGAPTEGRAGKIVYSDGTVAEIPYGVTTFTKELYAPDKFDSNFDVVSVELPDSVKIIDSYAFYDCENLVSVTIPEGVVHIGTRALAFCDQLKSIVIPASVERIEEGAFADSDELSITLNDGNTSYYMRDDCLIERRSKTLLWGCKTSVIPSDHSIERIGKSAFSNCAELRGLVIPDGVTDIGEGAFSHCINLTSLSLPDGIVSIGEDAFFGCARLGHVTIPATVTEIGEGAFSNCKLLSITVDPQNTHFYMKNNCLIETHSKTLLWGCSDSEIPLDGSVTVIGKYAFFSRDHLMSVTLPKDLTEIRYFAFAYSGITNITLPNGIKSIDFDVFQGCAALTSITFEGTISEWNRIYKHSLGKTLTVVCKDGVLTEVDA